MGLFLSKKADSSATPVVCWSAALSPGNASPGGHPEFRLELVTETFEPLQVYGQASFNGEFSGTMDEVGLSDIFDEKDHYVFQNPGLVIDIASNINLDMEFFLDTLASHKNGALTGKMESLTGSRGMPLAAREEEASYYIARENNRSRVYESSHFFTEDLNGILASTPTHITYNLTARTPGEQQTGSIPFKDPELHIEYRFIIPFSFLELRLDVEKRLEDVFTDDSAAKLFHDAGEFIIIADSVDVQVGGVGEKGATITTFIHVYNSSGELIDIQTDPALLHNGNNELAIHLYVGEKDVSAMQKARHLEFIFRIEGEDIAFMQDDYISINKLKFKTSNGLTWEF
ncbi:MAG: hypothetical protein LUE93_07185 [Bacteroides sp.]|nr:hypothetical protein [Bacteroides sp.]